MTRVSFTGTQAVMYMSIFTTLHFIQSMLSPQTGHRREMSATMAADPDGDTLLNTVSVLHQ